MILIFAKMSIREVHIIYLATALTFYFSGVTAITSQPSPEQYICNKLNATLSWGCMPKSECKWREEFHLYKEDVVCSLNSRTKERKICCAHNQHTSTAVSTGRTTTLKSQTVKSSTGKSPSAIVYEKCLDYAKSRFFNKTVHRKLLTDPPDHIKEELDCTYITPLIVGGEAARKKEFPHMALIGYKEDLDDISWNCGGSLISEQYIMSAAHCTAPSTTLGKATWALLGLLSKENFSPKLLNKNLFRIIDHFNHPEYRGPETENNDIALYKLEKPIALSPSIRPTCLSTSTDLSSHSGTQTSVTGWGVVGYGEAESETLLKATINLLSNDLCEQTYKDEAKYKNGFDRKTMVCAGHLSAARDTCLGDSGGPLQVPIQILPCMWAQIGVTSFGSAFCGNNVPAIYTKVANYIPWIQKIVWP